MPDFALTGTKALIFDAAIEMFASNSYEGVSMRDIAKRCEIKASSIYNHFPGKQDILGSIYDYYRSVYPEIQTGRERLLEIARDGTREEFVDALFPTFESLPEPHYHRMTLITKIIYMRVFNDPVANELFGWMGAKPHCQEMLDYAVQIGRLNTSRTAEYLELIDGYRTALGYYAFSDPSYRVHPLQQESEMKQFFVELLPFVD